MSHPKRVLRLAATILLTSVVLTIVVAWVCSASINIVGQGSSHTSAEAMTGEIVWNVERWDRPGAAYIVSRSLRDWSWSPSQATGAPNTAAAGDLTTAWASINASAQREWLTLEYANAVVPKSVRVYETHHPGAVDRVTVFAADGSETEAWRGVDPTPPATMMIGISRIPLHVNFPIRKLTIHLNSIGVPGWNEIDAVGLVSTAGDVQWATRATASSAYGARPVSAADLVAVKTMLPWGTRERLAQAMNDANASTVTRAIDARGWPMAALSCERDAITGQAIAGHLGSAGKPQPTPAVVPLVGLQSLQYSGPSTSSGTIPPAVLPASLPAVLPIRIVWPGFLFDVACYAAAIAALRWLVIHPWKLHVELSRMRRGLCCCGYDLVYDFRQGCPECGWRRKPRDGVSHATAAPRAHD